MTVPPSSAKDRLLVFVPTYNEKENAERLCREILRPGPGLRTFCSSTTTRTDGTGEILDASPERYASVKVIHRSGKLGIGSAHRRPGSPGPTSRATPRS